MKRRLLTALAAAVLLGASLQAPFAHIHPDDPDHHHATGLAHGHFEIRDHHDEAEGPEMEAPHDEEMAIFLTWAPAAEQRVVIENAEAPSGFTVEPVVARVGSAPEFRPRAHSPPSLLFRPARAPPL